jgi:D-glycero-D-manno-heptose 1,7-bisphosphate phosphatase
VRARPIIWLDRDGTVVDDPGYLDDPGRLALLPGAAEGVRRLNEIGTVVLVTNQSGIGRGYMTRETVDEIHARLERRLSDSGAHLDAIEICPHRPDEQCDCRKPRPGMILRARAEFTARGAEYVVGDKAADVGLARAAGCVAILVRTGEGRETEPALDPGAVDHVADDLAAAAEWIASREAVR